MYIKRIINNIIWPTVKLIFVIFVILKSSYSIETSYANYINTVVISVSYTHLDVYKRQVPMSLILVVPSTLLTIASRK